MSERRVKKVDKYEYKLRADEIKSLIQKKQYMEAAAIADTIDWKNVRNSVMLCTISDLYKACKRYEDSREVLLIAYDRNPSGRMIVYSLCELSIKLGDIFNAVEYLKEYAELAPNDSGRFVLKYKLFTAQGVGMEERIAVLEELQRRECKEKWMYELARLYHFAGYSQQCIEECNQIIIYFGEGKYVIKALELMSQHVELSEAHDILYRRLKNPEKEIVVSTMDVSQYNPDDLEKELAQNLKEVLSEEAPASEATSEEAVYTYESEVSEVNSEVTSESASEIFYDSEAVVSEPEVSEVSFETTMYKPVNIPEEPKEEATKIIDHKAVNEALMAAENPVAYEPKPEAVSIVPPSDTGFKGQVIEPRKSVWDMHEIDLGNRNSEAIKYPNYDDMVSVEGDGQISIVMPEQEQVDKQITGQISIDDVLLEWERMKDESDKRWAEEVKKRVMSQTTDLLKNFEEASKNGLLEELEISVAGGGKVVLTPEEQMALLNGEHPEALNISIDDVTDGSETLEEEIILLDESEFAEMEVASESVSASEEAAYETQSESAEESTVESEITVNSGDISEITVSESETSETAESESAEVNEDPTPEELSFDRTPYISDRKEEEVSDDTAVLPNLENLDYLMKFAAAIEDHDTAEKVIFGAAEMIAGNESPFDSVEKETTDAESTEVDKAEVISEETVSESVSEEITEETSEAAEEAVVISSEEIIEEVSEITSEVIVEETVCEAENTETEETSIEEVAEISEVAEEPASEDIIETSEAEEQVVENSESVDEEAADAQEEETIESPKELVSYSPEEVAVAVEPVSYGLLTEAQYDRFEDFVQTEGVDKQLVDALNNISMTASTGNVIVGSDDTDGAVEFGKLLITEVAEKGEVTGKVAKIKASTLNAKDVKATIEALENGAIIIQDIGDLKAETLNTLTEVISNSDFRIIVVLTANQRVKHKFIMEHKDIMHLFNVSVDIVSLDDKDLVEYGQKYAMEQEYIIDEMGLLALHRRVEEAQTNSHAVTVSEVRSIVDEAIDRASKKNVGHFFDILVGKRYDENDMIVLREKDFE